MKFDNKLQEDVFNYFNNRDDFYFHGYTGTFFFRTWKRGEEKHIITSKKPHGGKDYISATVYIHSNRRSGDEKYGVEIMIEMYMWGYQSEETVFQGWVENIDQLKVICNAVGFETMKEVENSNNVETQALNIPVVSGSYYWVKCFKDSEYEPAKAKDRYGNGVMYFCFTNGSVKECKYVVDYKELNYR